MRRISAETRTNGDEATAQELDDELAKSPSAGGVVMMKKMEGVDLGDVLQGFNKRAKPKEKDKAQQSGIDPLKLVADPRFHYNLGRLYTADGLIASADRLMHMGHRAFFNNKNLKVLTDGTIHTFDNDIGLVAYQIFRKSNAKDKSAQNWAKWLLEGGVVWDVGLETPAGMVQDLVTMFDSKVRKDLYGVILLKFKEIADDLAWDTFEEDFYSFDTWFMRGIVDELETITEKLDAMVEKAREMDQGQRGRGGIDPDALKLRGEYMKSMLPDLKQGGFVSDMTKVTSRAKFFSEAEKIVAKNKIADTAEDLTDFDQGLLPVPQRVGKMSAMTKMGRKMGRAVGKLSRDHTKRNKSKQAKNLRKGGELRALEGVAEDYQTVKGMGGGSRRQKRAEFDLGLQHAILAMHRRAIAFENADGDIMKLDSQIANKGVVLEHLAPYRKVVEAGGYTRTMENFKALAKGYRDQLDRKSDGAQLKELDNAERELTERQDGFDAGIFYIQQQLARAGVSGR
jgi:hypothetical protein